MTTIYNIFAENQHLFLFFGKNAPQQRMGLLNDLSVCLMTMDPHNDWGDSFNNQKQKRL